MTTDIKIKNIANVGYCLMVAQSQLERTNYKKSIAYLDNARQSLVRLQSIENKLENERLLDEAIRLVHEDYDLRKKV